MHLRRRPAVESPSAALAPEGSAARAMAHIQAEFTTFVEAAALDYLTTHSNPRRLPRDALEVLDLWLAEQDSADLPHAELWPTRSTLRDAGYEFAAHVEVYDTSDTLLEPEMVVAIRVLCNEAREALALQHGTLPPEMPPEAQAILDPARDSYRLLVAGTRWFADVLRRYAPPAVFEVTSQVETWAREQRAGTPTGTATDYVPRTAAQ